MKVNVKYLMINNYSIMDEMKYRRQALDKLLSGHARSGEDTSGLIRRLLGDLNKSSLPKDEMIQNQKQVQELLGHMALERNRGVNMDKYGGLERLLINEYPSIGNDIGAIIDPNDPDFSKKIKKLGSPIKDMGLATAYDDLPRSVGVSGTNSKGVPLNALEKASVGLHEGRHAVDYGMGYDSVPTKDADFDMIMKSRNQEDLINKMSNKHHLGVKSFEIDAMDKILNNKGLDAPKKLRKTVSDKAKEGSRLLGGKIRGLGPIGALIGVGMAASSGDVTAAIPGLDSADNVGMSAEDENLMLAEEAAKVDYNKSPAHKAKLEALSRLKR